MVAQGQDRRLVVADALRDSLAETIGAQLTRLGGLSGSELEGCSYSHPLAEQEVALARTSPVVVGGDYITTEAGTGLVHTAPGHGIEDYQVCQLPVLCAMGARRLPAYKVCTSLVRCDVTALLIQTWV